MDSYLSANIHGYEAPDEAEAKAGRRWYLCARNLCCDSKQSVDPDLVFL